MSRIVRVAGGALGPFTPARHGSALKLWRRADAGITLGTSPDITQWADQVAGGVAATVPGGSAVSPHLVDPKENGLPGVDFGDPASGNVALSAADNAIDDFWDGSGDKMLVLALHMDDSQVNGRVLVKGFSEDTSGTGWRIRNELGSTGGPYRLQFVHNFATTNYNAFTTDTIAHGGGLFVFVWDGTSADPTHMRINGSDVFSSKNGGTGAIDADAAEALYLGNRPSLGANLRGALLEIYFVKPAPTSIAKDEAYMNGKWAIF